MKNILLVLFLSCCANVFAAHSADLPVKVILDDFSSISSWLNMGERGVNPREDIYSTRLGSVENDGRDDGYCGLVHFDFVEDNGEIGFGKNEIYKTALDENALGVSLWVNPCGFSGRISIDLERSDKKFVRTNYIPVSGDQWMEIFIPFDPNLIEGMTPFVVFRMQFASDKPCKGEILVDDFAIEYDHLPKDIAPISARPVYRKLGWRPGEQVTMEYRFRNRLPTPYSGELKVNSGDLEIIRKIEIPPYGTCVEEFDFGVFNEKTAQPIYVASGDNPLHWGWISVFEPNKGPINKSPMWFAVEDQECNTFAVEGALHASWLPILGVDMIRAGLMGNIEQEKGGLREEAMRRLWAPHIEAGVKLLVDFAGYIPLWAMKENPKSDLDCNWEEFDVFVEHLAKFFNTMPEVHYFEFINEPNLVDLRKPMTDDYLTAIRRLYPIFKKHAPNILITTGGVCPDIPYALSQFIERLLAQPETFDIIAYHEHGDYDRYRFTYDIVKNMAGENHKPIINTEAGTRSLMTEPRQFYYQADQLVKKITYSKAVGMEYYNWFMLQDYWDKTLNADDSFGLVTVDNQPKPSFLAYAELIRQISNKEFTGNIALHPSTEAFRFSDDTDDVIVVWKAGQSAAVDFQISSDIAVTRTDIYGNAATLLPEDGLIIVPGSDLPFYLKAYKGAISGMAQILAFKDIVAGIAGETVKAKVKLSNPLNQELNYLISIDGKNIPGKISAKMQQEIPVRISISKNEPPGMRTISAGLTLSNEQEAIFYGNFSLDYACCLEIPKKGMPEIPITLDSAATLRELVFDPTIPSWGGKDDLSARVFFSWSKAGLNVKCSVTDQEHNGDNVDGAIWRNDSIQFAIDPMNGKNWTEYTFSLTPKGAEAWNHYPPDGFQAGNFKGDYSVVRNGNVTEYSFTIPPERLGFELKNGAIFRMALQVNDSDLGVRSRIMTLFGGIEGEKDPKKFGFAQLCSAR